ncbi:GD22455 [Drosophila simulans]|uniref:GD22455 n=1 Tax=Drosophila simulans TaxID=7240 RepID=B4Q675_DROSI|nr:GD22455 [Drosophila simulans]
MQQQQQLEANCNNVKMQTAIIKIVAQLQPQPKRDVNVDLDMLVAVDLAGGMQPSAHGQTIVNNIIEDQKQQKQQQQEQLQLQEAEPPLMAALRQGYQHPKEESFGPRCPEPQAPKPASSIEEHARKLQQPQQQDDSDLWLHNCQSKSMGRKLLPLCCAVHVAVVVGVAPIHDSVGLHCQRRLPLPFAVSIGISASTFTSNSIGIAIATAISMSHVPSLMSMSVAVVVNICHDLIVKRSHVAAMALLPCPRLPPLWKPPVPHPCATTAVTWVQLFF